LDLGFGFRFWVSVLGYGSVSQSERNRPLGGYFDGQGGEKNKGDESAQRLIDF